MIICPKCNRLRPTDSTVVVSSQGWDSITGLTPPHFCACSMPGIGFLTSYIYVVVFFVFNSLRWQVDFHFLEIDGIVYLRYLIFHKKASTSHSIHRLKLTYSLYDLPFCVIFNTNIYRSVCIIIQLSVVFSDI